MCVNTCVNDIQDIQQPTTNDAQVSVTSVKIFQSRKVIVGIYSYIWINGAFITIQTQFKCILVLAVFAIVKTNRIA